MQWQVHGPTVTLRVPVSVMTARNTHCTSDPSTMPQEAELTEGEFEMEDELEDMEDLAEAADGAGPSSDEDDEEDEDAAPATHSQRGRQRPGPKQGALRCCSQSPAGLVLSTGSPPSICGYQQCTACRPVAELLG